MGIDMKGRNWTRGGEGREGRRGEGREGEGRGGEGREESINNQSAKIPVGIFPPNTDFP